MIKEPLQRRFILASAGAHLEAEVMRSILLYLIGIPIPIILLLAFCTHHL